MKPSSTPPTPPPGGPAAGTAGSSTAGPPAREGPAATDWGLAAALGLVAAVLYRLTATDRFGFDGPQLATTFALAPDQVHWHVLYLPLARALDPLLPGAGPYEALRTLGALGGGLGVAASLVLARALGLARGAALGAAAVLALSPHVWFFSSVVEVHSLHLAVVGLAACATVLAPWRRPAVALPIASLAFGATWFGHATAPLLGPGWILLVAAARARVARPFRPRSLVLGVGPALLLGLAALAVPIRLAQSEPGQAPIDVRILRSYAAEGDSLAFLVDGLLVPLGLLTPVVLLGLTQGRGRGARLAALGLLLPPTLFFLWWGIPEGGGYMAGLGVAQALAAALALERLGPRARGGSLALLVLVQGSLALGALERFDARLDPRERVALVDELLAAESGPALVGTLAFQAPSVEVRRPAVEQLDLVRPLLAGRRAGTDPEALAEQLASSLEAVVDERPLLLDVTAPGDAWSHVDASLRAYVRRFVEALLARLPHRRARRDGWRFVAIESPGPEEHAAEGHDADGTGPREDGGGPTGAVDGDQGPGGVPGTDGRR